MRDFLNQIHWEHFLGIVKKISIIFLLYTICRLLFFSFNQSLFEETTFSDMIIIMLGGLRFDLTAILYINSIFILGNLLPNPWRTSARFNKFWLYWFLVTNAFFLSMNFIDMGYFKFTLTRTTADIFDEFSHETNLGSLFFRFVFVDYIYLTLLFCLSVYGMKFLYKKNKIKPFEIRNKKIFYIGNTLLMLVTIYFMIVGIRGGFTQTTRPITISNAGEYVNRPEEMSIVLNTPFSIFRTLNKPKLKIHNYFTDEQLKEYYSPIHTYETGQKFQKKNVIIFIVESLSKEFVGALNKDTGVKNYKSYTPFLDSLIGKSLVFPNMYANGSKSIDALPSIVSSVPSLIIHYVLSHYALNETQGLAKILKDKGYKTSFFHGAPNGSMGFEAFMNVAGFEDYYGKDEYGNDEDFDGYWGIWDEKFFQFFAHAHDEKIQEPFLSVLFSLSSHHPFVLPTEYKGKFPKGDIRIHKTVGYIDYSLRNFFETATQKKWFKNTLFVITADHVGDGYYPEYQTTIGRKQIPLIIYDPEQKFVGIDSSTADQVDILPTVLSLIDYQGTFFSFGQNLLDKSVPHFAINSISSEVYQIIQFPWVLQFSPSKNLALYNIENDIMMKEDLLSQNNPILDTLETLGRAFVQSYNKRMVNNKLIVK